MSTFYRRDDDVQNGIGQAMPNIAVAYYVQPGGQLLAAIFADPAGATRIANPQYTNGLGQTAAYMMPGLYTVVYSGAQIQTLTYPDQIVGEVAAGATPPMTPTPAADGTVRIFTLPSAPPNPAGDQFFVAGSLVSYGVAYTVSGTTLTWIGAVPPQQGDSLDYFIL